MPPRASKSGVSTRATPSSVRTFIDLTEQQNKAPAEKIFKGQSSGQSAAPSVPQDQIPGSPVHSSATKKRKAASSDVNEPEVVKGVPDLKGSDLLIMGTEQVMKGPDFPELVRSLKLDQGELLRTGLGHLIQVTSLLYLCQVSSGQS